MPSPIFTNGADVLAEIFHSTPLVLRLTQHEKVVTGFNYFNYKSQINSKFFRLSHNNLTMI